MPRLSRKTHAPWAILAPGYGANARQPLLLRLAHALKSAGIRATRMSFKRARPSAGYLEEVTQMSQLLARTRAKTTGPVFLVGRSFGGRMAAFTADRNLPDGLVILGHPISPPGKPRPADVEVLARLTCPTCIIQGDADELGPLPVLKKAARRNPNVRLVVLEDTGHSYSSARREERALRACVEFLKEITARP